MILEFESYFSNVSIILASLEELMVFMSSAIVSCFVFLGKRVGHEHLR